MASNWLWLTFEVVVCNKFVDLRRIDSFVGHGTEPSPCLCSRHIVIELLAFEMT